MQKRSSTARCFPEVALGGANRDKILQAVVIKAMQKALADGEQMLGVTVCRLAGGLRGRLQLGVGGATLNYCAVMLTDRRLVLHRYPVPVGVTPHARDLHEFTLASIAAMDFEEIETYGGEPSCRLIVRLANDAACRLRIRGQWRCSAASDICRVFAAIAPSSMTPVTLRRCPNCSQRLDGDHRYCPYCGKNLKQDGEDGRPVQLAIEQASDTSVNALPDYDWHAND